MAGGLHAGRAEGNVKATAGPRGGKEEGKKEPQRTFGAQESRDQMIDRACLATVGPKLERVHAPGLAVLIEHRHIGVEVVDVVRVRWVLVAGPVLGQGHVLLGVRLGLAFIVDAVEPHDVFQQVGQLRVVCWVGSGFEQRPKDVVEHLGKGLDQAGLGVDVKDAWGLDEPPDVWGVPDDSGTR